MVKAEQPASAWKLPLQALLVIIAQAQGQMGDGSWTEPADSGAVPAAKCLPAVAWDDESRVMYTFGGYDDYGGYDQRKDLHAYNAMDNTWQKLPDADAYRHGHAAVWIPKNRTVLVWGGTGPSDAGGPAMRSLIAFDVDANAWRDVSPSGDAPVAHWLCTAVWDNSRELMYVFGGSSTTGEEDHLHAYSPTDNAWTLRSPRGPGRNQHSAVWDDSTSTMLIYGGYSGQYLGDIQAYDANLDTWTELFPEGLKPVGRFGHSATWISETRTMLVFGGGISGGRLNDLWAYSAADNTWTQLFPSNTWTQHVVHHRAVWDAAAGVMHVFGGLLGLYPDDYPSDRLHDYHAELPTSTATTSTSSSTATTTPPCPAGSDDRNAPADPCTPCEPGRYSWEGEACKPVVEHAVGQLTVPSLALVWDDQSTVTLTLTLDDLPTPTDTYETDNLSYILDVKSTLGELDFNNTCDQRWTDAPRSPYANVSLTYDELSIDCCLAEDSLQEPPTIVREGFIGVFVIIGTGAEARKIRLWVIPLQLDFNAEVANSLPVGTAIDNVLTGETFQVGGFASTLRLMEDDFSAARGNSDYELGEFVYVQQKLEVVSADLDLRIEMAWLSTSSDPAVDATVRELTDTIVLQASDGPSTVQFSFAAGGCESCYLHVLSEVVHQAARRLGGRRLPAGGDYLVNSIYVRMLPAPPASEPEEATEPAGLQINLQLLVQGVDYHALTARPSLEERFVGILKRSIAERVGNGIHHENVSVTLSPGSVNVSFQVRMPVDIDVAAAKRSVEDETFGPALEASVGQGVESMEGLHLVMSGPLVTRLLAVEFMEVTREEPQRYEEAGLGPSLVAGIAVSVCVLLLLGTLGFLYTCCLRRRAQQRRVKVVDMTQVKPSC